MRKIYLFSLFCCLSIVAKAQTAAQYTFARTTGAYTSIVGGTGTVATTAISGDDQVIQNVPIGFSFIFCGNTSTQVSVNSNGWLSLANSSLANGIPAYTNSAANLASNAGGVGVLMPRWDDLNGTGSTAYYQTSGTAPTRVFTFQWGSPASQWGVFTGSGTGTFQVKLYESSNVIEFVYGDASFSGGSGSIGIANSSTDFLTLANESSTSASTTFSSVVATFPAQNTVMTWTPSPTIILSPSSLSFTENISTASASQNISVIGYGFTTSPVSVNAPTNFQVYNGTTYVGSMTIATSSAAVGTYINTTLPVRFVAPGTTGTSTGDLAFSGAGLATAVNAALTGNAVNPCSGTPDPGTVTASPSTGGCSSFASTLSLSGATIAANLTYQWQTSTDSAAWTSVSGATNATFATTIGVATYYRCQVTCTNSSITSNTPGLRLASGPSYATLPFNEGFEASWQSICGIAEVPNNFWRGNPITGNNSWRRQDDPSGPNTGAWGSPTSGTYSPAFSTGSFSARFHSFLASTGTVGTLDLHVNLPAGTKQITYDYINTSGTDVLLCQVSTNGGSTFTTMDAPPVTATAWTTRTFNTDSAATTAIIRFRATSDFGATDIGLDNVNINLLLPCVVPTAQPTTLNLTSGLTTVNGTFTAASPAPTNYLVVMTTTATAPSAPVDGTTYTVGSNALGGKIIANGSGTSFAATGLTPGVQYWYWIYSYNSAICSGGPLYLASSPLAGDISTTTCSLSGVKTVGPTGDYATITDAVAAATSLGLAGPTAFEIQTTYAGTGETLPIVIGNITCASSVNTLTIRPQGTIVLAAPVTGPMLDLNGANYVIIDGRVGSTGTTKAMTISNLTTAGQDIRFINDASNNIVQYCTLLGASTTTTNGTILFSTTSATTGNDNNLIDNCDIMDGATTPVNGILSTGTAGKENSGNTISNCNIANYFSASTTTNGIVLNAGNTDWTINNNRFYQTVPRTYTTSTTHRGIFVNNTAGNNFTVTNNTIGFANAAGTGTYTMSGTVASTFQGIAISVGNTAVSSVQGNTINNISLSGTNGVLTGILVSAGTVNVGTVAGNTIGSAATTGAITNNNSTSANTTVLGISVAAASPAIVNVRNNQIGGITVNGSSTAISSGVTGIQVSSTGTDTIANNLIGSNTTAASIHAATASTSATAQQVVGILTSNTGNGLYIQGNTISNMVQSGTTTAHTISGIVHQGANTGAVIMGNTIKNIFGANANTTITGLSGVNGISVTSGTAPVIQGNEIYTLMATNIGAVQSNVVGISLGAATNGTVLGNRIYDLRNASTGTTATTPPTAMGILIGNALSSGTIVNNMISLGNAQTSNTEFIGIANTVSAAGTIRVYHNSVNIEGTASAGSLPSVGFHRGNNTTSVITSTIDVRNNIFNNKRNGGSGKHYAIANGLNATASTTGWAGQASNYNILNSASASTVGFWSGDQSFASWKIAANSDQNSNTASTVTFVNAAAGNLHTTMLLANNVESHGTLIAGFTTDIDGDGRPGPVGSVNGGGFAPDLGADEFDGVPLENLPPVITYDALLPACGTGDRTLTASIIDPGAVPLVGSGFEPRVYFKKGIAGAWFSRSGTRASGTSTNGIWNFTIEASLMGGLTIGDQVFYFIIAQDNFGNIGSNPGAGLVASDVNTVSVAPTTPNNYMVMANMSGTYTVGASGTYPTITAAVAAYNNSCLSGPVTLSLTDAAYTAETLPITINSSVFANSTNTLTIQPATGVTASISGASTTGVFVLNGADYVSINGSNAPVTNTVCPPAVSSRDLTITNTSTSTTSAVIWMQTSATADPATNNTISNCNIAGNGNTQTMFGVGSGGTGISYTSRGNGNNNNRIENNSITATQTGIYSSGASAGVKNQNTVINQNIMSGMRNNGIIADFENNVNISGNNISNLTNGVSTDAVAISVGFGNNGINNASNLLNEVTNATITYNKIDNISQTNTFGCAGIAVVGASSGITLVANNMLGNIGSTSTPSDVCFGILIGGNAGSVANVYYNTVSLSGTFSGGSTPSFALAIAGNNPVVNLRNNILRNEIANSHGSHLAIGLAYSTFTNLTSENNNLYTAGSDLCQTGVLTTAGTKYTSLAAWRSATGKDMNSKNVNPVFVSSTDLRLAAVPANTELAGTGAAVTVTTDMNCNVRGTLPTIGVNEIVPDAVLGANPVLCSGATTALQGVSNIPANATSYSIAWDASALGQGFTNVVAGAIPTTELAIAVPATAMPAVYTGTMTLTNGILTSPGVVVALTVKPAPALSSASNNGPVCAGALLELDANSPTDVTDYSWTGPVAITDATTANASVGGATMLAAGIYTVTVRNDTGAGCSAMYTTSVTVHALPADVAVTGAGTYCNDGTITADNGGDGTIYFQGTTTDGTSTVLPSTSEVITVSGTYYFRAQSTDGCWGNEGSAVVVVNPLPVVHTVTGGGHYCAGGTGVSVGLNGSDLGIRYQLFEGATAVGTALDGDGSALDFGAIIPAGTYTVLATDTTTTCTNAMSSNAVVVADPLPTVYNVVGGGAYCAGTVGSNIALDNSDTGVIYQVYESGSAIGSPLVGTGTALDFGMETTPGTYTILGTNMTTLCTQLMAGADTISIKPVPAAFTVTGSGTECAGGTGFDVVQIGSDLGFTYQLWNGTTAITAPFDGTGSDIHFGFQTTTGNYTVLATDTMNLCTSVMSGTASIVINPLPVRYNVTGDGAYCASSAGSHIGLSNSNLGIRYQLYDAAGAVGTAVDGVAGPLDFGLFLTPGTYFVVGTDTTTLCTDTMTGTTTITVNPLPIVVNVTGGGGYCLGGTGVIIGLDTSEVFVNYQLHNGTTAVGTAVAGTGAIIDFGSITAAGTYTVMATDANTGCTNSMAGSTSVTINPLPAVYTLTGGGIYCAEGTGVSVGLSGSDTGFSYQLYNGTSLAGAPLAGTAGALDFGLQTGTGAYGVVATDTLTGCVSNMISSVTVSTNPLPTLYTVTGGGSYCAGGTGVHVGLGGSSIGFDYQLYNGTSTVGGLIAGTGSPLDFGLLTTAGTYSVVSINPITLCSRTMLASATVAVNPIVTPAVAILSSDGTEICVGTAPVFTASGTHAGSTPVYEWFVNDTSRSTGATYSYVPVNGDIVTVKLTSNADCRTVDTAIGVVSMLVNEYVMPTATITATPGNSVCNDGSTVTFEATYNHGGSAPTFTWIVNSIVTGTGSTFAYVPTDADNVIVSMTSNQQCRLATTVTSNTVAMDVNEPYLPSVTITARPGLTIGVGKSDTLTATVTGAGPAPTYQWYKGSTALAGATNATYVSSTFANNDSVTCKVTGTAPCGYTSFNSVIIKVVANVGIADVSMGGADIRVVPNPNKGEFVVKGTIAAPDGQEVTIEITNMLGQSVFADKAQVKDGALNIPVKLSNGLASGMYMLSLKSGAESKVFHIVLEQQ